MIKNMQDLKSPAYFFVLMGKNICKNMPFVLRLNGGQDEFIQKT